MADSKMPDLEKTKFLTETNAGSILKTYISARIITI